MILPPPTDATLTIDVSSIDLALPKLGAAQPIAMKEPENPSPLPDYIEHAPGKTQRSVTRDLSSSQTHYHIHEDTGLHEHPGTGLSTRQLRDEIWSITENDPTSMTGRSTWTCDMARPGWSVRTISTANLSCTATDWRISASVIAYEGDEQVFEKTWDKVVARDMM